MMNIGILMEGAVGTAFNIINDIISIFANPPLIYFVGVALVGATAGVARKFVPMRKR